VVSDEWADYTAGAAGLIKASEPVLSFKDGVGTLARSGSLGLSDLRQPIKTSIPKMVYNIVFFIFFLLMVMVKASRTL